jgi:tRNA (guanine-N7-)-methyltransferase
MKSGGDAPTRHHNPYLKDALNLSNVLFTSSEAKERFPNIFPNSANQNLLEIGCYLGKSVLEFAQHNPNLNVLGLDITYKRVVKSAKKIQKENIQNARIAICEAHDFLSHIPNESLLGVCVFFPDPWPKKKHAKNRLLSQEFGELLLAKLAPKGFFWFKTDSEPYFLQVSESFSSLPFQVSNPDYGVAPVELIPMPYRTAFEELFLSQNLPIYTQIFRKP